MTDIRERPARKPLTVYEQYMCLETLFELQLPEEERLFPDELTFQVVHQTFELWWKVELQLLQRAVACLEQGLIVDATVHLHRSALIQGTLLQVVRQLEFLSPLDFLRILQGRGNGSGAQSPGFHTIRKFAPTLWNAFEAALTRAGITLVELYLSREKDPALYRLAEALTDFDESMYTFRASHLKIAQRFLGLHPMGPPGAAMVGLEKRVQDVLFPALWEARAQLPPLFGRVSSY